MKVSAVRRFWIVAALLSSTPLGAQESGPSDAPITSTDAAATRGLRVDYRNPWFVADPVGLDVEPIATSFFGGAKEVCDADTEPPTAPSGCPTDETLYLVGAAFGQPFSPTIPFSTAPNCPIEPCGFVDAALLRASKLLYYTEADAGPDNFGNFIYDRELAAFEYKVKLYADLDGEGPLNQLEAYDEIGARLSSMTDFYLAEDRERLELAEIILRDALKYAPMDERLRTALLDLYYDRAVAEQALAKEQLVDAVRARLEPPPAGSGRVINNEIATYEAILGDPATPGGYRYALAGYFELLTDPMGVNPGDVEPPAGAGQPFGSYLFQQEVPDRSLYAASYLAGEAEVPTSVVADGGQPGCPADPNPCLFAGFKDLVLLFDLLAAYGDAAAHLARLYMMRAQGTDLADALDLINEAQERLHIEGSLLLGLFSSQTLPGSSDASGLAAAIAGWRHGQRDLQSARSFLRGESNLLGYDEDFLMLVQKLPSGGGDVFDSYDALYGRMEGSSTAPLTRALEKSGDALDAFEDYRGNQDELASQYQALDISYNARLLEIVGANRGHTGYGSPPACGQNEINEGSEICLQLSSIEAAANRVQQNGQRIANLRKQVEFEVDRRAREAGIEAGINQVVIEYSGVQARLTEEIGRIEADQAEAATNADDGFSLTGIVSSLTGAGSLIAIGSVVSGLVSDYNASFQSRPEEQIAAKEAEKERLAALERAEINDLEGQILDLNSSNQIRTWLLQMSTLALESKEATLLMRQEVARLAALVREVEEVERRMDRENQALIGRYFADPIHLLRMQSAMVAAFEAFEVAQHWTFYTARALEYKWNIPLLHTFEGETWSTGSLFGLRNAEELQDMLAAMNDLNDLLGTATGDDYFDFFSVRKDFFGYSEDDPVYEDPDTGELIGGVEAFRRELARRMDAGGNIFIDFSTVREIPGGTFFRGPRFAADGTTLISKGLYLDKIQWVKILLPGTHSTVNTQLAGVLTYGGTSYIRNEDVGTRDPSDPSHVEGEMTQYPTRYWHFDGTLDQWQFKEGLSVPIAMQKSPDPNVPPTVAEAVGFAERSVAATGWRLLVPTIDGVLVLDVDELDDIQLYFYHRAFARP